MLPELRSRLQESVFASQGRRISDTESKNYLPGHGKRSVLLYFATAEKFKCVGPDLHRSPWCLNSALGAPVGAAVTAPASSPAG
jgi:hypothetical protein